MVKEAGKHRLAIGSDHAGFAVKEAIKAGIPGVEWLDQGTFSTDSTDYPDWAEKVGALISTGTVERGVLVCGTGIGMSISANKIRGIRAAVVESELAARMARAHNDANVLCLGSRILAPEYAREIVKAWLETVFEGGRHQKRINKIAELEKKNHG